MCRFLPGITDFSPSIDFCLKAKEIFQKIKVFFNQTFKDTFSVAKLTLFTVQRRLYCLHTIISKSGCRVSSAIRQYQNLEDALVIYRSQHCSTVGVYHFSQWQTPQEDRCSNEIYSPYLEICWWCCCTSTELLILFQLNCVNEGILRPRTLKWLNWENIYVRLAS